jgi:predicted Zn-dependent protease
MNEQLSDIAGRFARLAPAVDFWSLRLVDEHRESLTVRQDVLQPLHTGLTRGAFLTVLSGDGMGYAATSDLSDAGLRRAAQRAADWARDTAGRGLVSPDELPRPDHRGRYETPMIEPWESVPLTDKIAMLQEASAALRLDERIVDWSASLAYRRSDTLLTASAGARIEQRFHYLAPGLVAVAHAGSQTQRRTGGGAGSARQGGLEQLATMGFPEQAPQIAHEALALLDAPECPSATTDLLLLPSQMVLQIHESIGHPLELDRILGDERNYAGTSFVSLDMFGRYRYGSELLNVTFDPGRSEELASYGYDDDGTPAERVHLIRNGILERPLGGSCSQARAGIEGTANARASDWHRPPIDRMANLNVEPGEQTLEQLIAGVERGVLMETNRSWSIDDSRNKFQFGCELGRLIEDGELKGLVRNPNYRGISATFWRNLAAVGDRGTYDVQGTPYCGKGEPNQMIHVGHASPACVFKEVEVFGGAG